MNTKKELSVCFFITVLAAVCLLVSSCQTGGDVQGTGASTAGGGQTGVRAILDAYQSVYNTPPDDVKNSGRTPDAPLMGNGDIAVAMGGASLTDAAFYISKSDLNQSTRGVGFLALNFKGDAGDPAAYSMGQDMYQSIATASIPLTSGRVEMRSWVSDNANLLVTELRNIGAEEVLVDVVLNSHRADGAGVDAADGIIYATRQITENSDGASDAANPRMTKTSTVTMATKALGADLTGLSAARNQTAQGTLKIPPQQTVRLLTSVGGGRDSDNHQAEAVAGVQAYHSAERIDSDYQQHLDWWKKYWEKSYIKLNDELLERFYYGALYSLGCGSRKGGTAPGLTGPWNNGRGAQWGNRNTLNYNFQAMGWGVYAANRAELALPFYDVNLKLIPHAKVMAETNVKRGLDASKWYTSRGVLFGINAHTWGAFADERSLHMKGNAGLSLLSFMMHYEYTRDDDFLLNTVWPLLKEVELFWSDEVNNLCWDSANERWEIRGSAAREGQGSLNPGNDIAYVTRMFRFLLRHSDTLAGKTYNGETIKCSQAQKEKWRHYLDHISEMPTYVYSGNGLSNVTTFRENEGHDRISPGGPGDNTDVLMAVYPAEFVSMGSAPNVRKIAQDTVLVMNSKTDSESWYQKNSMPKIYNQAIRSGYSADITMAALKRMIAGNQPTNKRDHVHILNNNTMPSPEHGWESVGAIESINSMLIQSHDDVIRLFPNWLTGQDGWFKSLAAYGGFTVSAAYDGSRERVASASVTSNKGKTATVQSPWRGMRVTDSHGKTVKTVRSREKTTGHTLYTFDTKAGMTYTLQPISR